MQNRICFIIPYYGTLPGYFPLWVNSLSNQPFDVLFFSDIDKPSNLPGNVVWTSMAFNDLKSLISSKLGFAITLNKNQPYKLCDYKPALGLIFESFTAGYEFWGSVDVDTIFGDFSKFVPNSLLDSIDVYSGIKEYLSGSLFLVRNNAFCNSLFKKSKDLVKIFTDESYLGFDECGGKYYEQLKAGEDIFELGTDVQSFTELIFFEQKKELRASFVNEILEPAGEHIIRIEKNKVICNDIEFLILHFIYLKYNYYFKMYPSITNYPYYITTLGNFKDKPNMVRSLFSRNMVDAIIRKVQINLRKLKR